MTRRSSIALRLVASSAVWIGLTLALTAALVVFLFHGHIRDRLERQLADHLEELVAAGDIGADGRLSLTWTPADPRFNRPRSGWYWQITAAPDTEPEHRSPSLWTDHITTSVPPLGQSRFSNATGPSGAALYVLHRTIALPRARHGYVFTVAGPAADLVDDIKAFAGALAVVMGVLSLFLLALIWVQIGYGLRPLSRLRANLAAIRSGETGQLADDFPKEIAPLVSELNALMAYNARLLERARAQVANLAHALKNPLAILTTESRALDGETGARLRAQIGQASDSVTRHLHQARIAGARNLPGAVAAVADTVQDLKQTLEILHRDKAVDISVHGLDGLAVKVERDDLMELLGNLMDNAVKWADAAVSVHVLADGAPSGMVRLLIDDDGPGIAVDARDAALQRGRRLDEHIPGTGFGLPIAMEIATLYGGALTLDTAPSGGLRIVVDLPRAGG